MSWMRCSKRTRSSAASADCGAALGVAASNRKATGTVRLEPFIRDPYGNRRHVVVRCGVAAKLEDGGEDRIDDFARGLQAHGGHHREQPVGAELEAARIVGVVDAVGTEHIDVAGQQVE